jgi:hypothetical protein
LTTGTRPGNGLVPRPPARQVKRVRGVLVVTVPRWSIDGTWAKLLDRAISGSRDRRRREVVSTPWGFLRAATP